MAHFPLIKDLPALIDSTGWNWQIYNTPSFPSKEFWLGTDLHGNKWLTKLSGSFYAYREIVFAKLAQKMGWSCQSSTFLKLDTKSAELLNVNQNEIHAAHWFLIEHQEVCSQLCPFNKLVRPKRIKDIESTEILHIIDWPKSDIAAYLFGANECSDHIFTADHEFVIIDSEQMFSVDPYPISKTGWWERNEDEPSIEEIAFWRRVCQDIDALSSSDIEIALAIPNGVSIKLLWPISEKIEKTIKYANKFLDVYS